MGRSAVVVGVGLVAALATAGGAAGRTGWTCLAEGPASAVTLSLVPDQTTLSLEDAGRGGVGFTARITNDGDREVKVAHPAVCFPADYEPGDTRRLEDSRGHSEILLTVVRPGGDRVVLRDGLFGLFEPGHIDHLVVGPGKAASFHLGWFFPNARGRWENDARAWRVFLDEGEYRVSVLFRNQFPKAWIRGDGTGRWELVPVWTGEMESEAVTVTIDGPTDGPATRP